MRYVSTGDFDDAVDSLSSLIVIQAEAMRDQLGFGWGISQPAPSTFDDVLDTYFACHEDQIDYPVAPIDTETTIYSSAEVAAAYRFWHDMTHVRLHCDYSYWDERAVSEFHLQELELFGVEARSLPWLLFRADTIGQNEFYRLSGGGLVSDRRAFAISAVEHGLGVALLHELALAPPLKQIAKATTLSLVAG